MAGEDGMRLEMTSDVLSSSSRSSYAQRVVEM